MHDFCHYPEGHSEKQITFTPNQRQLEGSGFKNTVRKFFKRTREIWNNFKKPGLKKATPIISSGVAAKSKNLQPAQITSNISKSLTGDKNSSFTDMHGNGLRLRVMQFISNKIY